MIGKTFRIKAKVEYQVCDDQMCLPPVDEEIILEVICR